MLSCNPTCRESVAWQGEDGSWPSETPHMSCDPVSILRTAVLTALLMPSAFPSRAATGDIGAEAVSARFDADARETRVTGHLTQSLCVSLALPQEWRMSAGPSGASLKEASG